jgi:hypothetical protein
MGADGVFPPEMPDTPYDPAERLLGGRLDPEDAPPGYAEVARVLRAAAGPPCPDELADSRPPWPRSTGSATAPGFAPAWSPWPSPGPWPSGACGSPTAPIPRLGYCPPPGGPAAAGRGQGRPLARRGRVGPGRLRQGRVGRLRGRAVGRRSCPRPVSGRSPAHGGGGASRGGGSARGVRPATSSRAEPGRAEPGKAKPGKAGEAGRGGWGEGR